MLKTTEISEEQNPKTLNESKTIVQKDGGVASAARKQLESNTGKNVVTKLNVKTF